MLDALGEMLGEFLGAVAEIVFKVAFMALGKFLGFLGRSINQFLGLFGLSIKVKVPEHVIRLLHRIKFVAKVIIVLGFIILFATLVYFDL